MLLTVTDELSGHPPLFLPQERQRTPGAGLPALQLLQEGVGTRKPVELLRDLLPLRSERTYVVPGPSEAAYRLLPGLPPQRRVRVRVWARPRGVAGGGGPVEVRLKLQHSVQTQHRVVPVRLRPGTSLGLIAPPEALHEVGAVAAPPSRAAIAPHASSSSARLAGPARYSARPRHASPIERAPGISSVTFSTAPLLDEAITISKPVSSGIKG
ncbi:hypothetical protein ACFQVA_12975 [Actinomadura keratinilytica]